VRPLDLLIGALFAGAIAVAARRARALTTGGALAAFAVGTVTYASGTLGFTFVLLAFFVPSVVLSRVGKRRKRALVDIGKAGARDAMQVLANGLGPYVDRCLTQRIGKDWPGAVSRDAAHRRGRESTPTDVCPPAAPTRTVAGGGLAPAARQ